MEKIDFRVSPDTVYWSIICILIFSVVCAYRIGYDLGVKTEKIGWLEDQALQQMKGEENE